jgi:iron complex outermembrane recepter protein
MRHSLKTIFLISAAFCLPSLAVAQEASQSEDANGIAEIVVTATKRSEALQDVPVSVTAFSSEAINQLGLSGSQDLAAYTPNLQWTSGTGYSRPSIYMRGLGNNSFHVNANGAVGIYTDGVYLGSMITHPFQLFDLERVEVLRGPQGTLYGRNTTAGLINFISVKPDIGGGADGFVEVTGGKFGQFDIEAAATAQLGDKAAIRFAALYNSSDGFFDTPAPGNDFDDYGARDTFALRSSLAFEPSDNFSGLLTFRYGLMKANPLPYKQSGLVFDASAPFVAPCPTANPALGQCTDNFGFADNRNYHDSFAQFPGREDTRSIGGQLELNAKLSDTLTLTSLTAYDDATLNFFGDEDASPTAQLHDGAIGQSRFWSQELRLTSDMDGPFNFIFGGNYYHEKLRSTEYFTLTAFGPGVLTGVGVFGVPEGAAQFLDQKTETFAFFGNANYRLTDQLTLTADRGRRRGCRTRQSDSTVCRTGSRRTRACVADRKSSLRSFAAVQSSIVV